MQLTFPFALSLSATFGLLAAGGAYAAPGGMGMGMAPPPTPSPSYGQVPSASAEASRIPQPSHAVAASGLKAGMTVKDSAGVTVGKITKVGTSGGAEAALVEVDGKTVVVMGSTLSISGDTATSTQTKEQIAASPQPKPS